VILDEDLKAKVQHDYRSFFKSEDVYKDLAVPWKRGLIFLGVRVLSFGNVPLTVAAPRQWKNDQHQGDHEGCQGACAIRQVVTQRVLSLMTMPTSADSAAYGGDEFGAHHHRLERVWLKLSGIRMIFTRARAEAPCVLILEDLDSLITDQNRSFFLNEVDGLEDNDGLLLVGFDATIFVDPC
jgi:hypothetical protein